MLCYVIALWLISSSPATKRSSDLDRYSPDIHPPLNFFCRRNRFARALPLSWPSLPPAATPPPLLSMSGAPAGALFTSSITSRRFPALRGLSEDDVEVMALPPRPTADRKAKQAAAGKGNRLFDPDLVKPSAVTNLSPMTGARAGLDAGGSTTSKASPKKQQDPRPPFRPTGKKQGRDTISVEHTGFVLMHSPYDMGFRQRQQERLAANNMRLAGGFHPPSLSGAKSDVSVNYFLNSPDAETIEAERRYIQDKVRVATPSRRIAPPPASYPTSKHTPLAALHGFLCSHACVLGLCGRGEGTWWITTDACVRNSPPCARLPTEVRLPRPHTPPPPRPHTYTAWTACPIAPPCAVSLACSLDRQPD